MKPRNRARSRVDRVGRAEAHFSFSSSVVSSRTPRARRMTPLIVVEVIPRSQSAVWRRAPDTSVTASTFVHANPAARHPDSQASSLPQPPPIRSARHDIPRAPESEYTRDAIPPVLPCVHIKQKIPSNPRLPVGSRSFCQTGLDWGRR